MPDPVWTFQYQMNQSPEQNGFTRKLYGTPSVVEVVSGAPANRRVEIQSNNGGSVVFTTSQVPALDPQIGCTMEIVCSCVGAGNAGIELTFLNRAVMVQVYENEIRIYMANDGGEQVAIAVPTASNATDITLRVTFDPTNTIRVYRNGAVIVAGQTVPVAVKPFQRVLWWGEEGGTQIFRALKTWLGGAMAPG